MKGIAIVKRRIICLLLLAVMLIGTCACSSDDEYKKDDRDEEVESETLKTSKTDKDENDEESKGGDYVVTNDEVPSANGTEGSVETEAPVVDENTLDPFAGLKVEFDGISPFCTVSFNNAKCSENVQQYVEYSIEEDKVTTKGKQFKLNEEVTIYASLKKGTDKAFTLAKTQQNYKVENVPEYITEITEDMDLSKLKSEMKDYFDSITAFTNGCNALGVGEGYMSHTPIQYHESYFSALKLHSYDKFKTNKEFDHFNKINIMYSTILTVDTTYGAVDKNCYFTVCAKNIVRYPDGTIGWGKSGPDTLAFEYNKKTSNMESLVNANITSIKADFNVTKINGILP